MALLVVVLVASVVVAVAGSGGTGGGVGGGRSVGLLATSSTRQKWKPEMAVVLRGSAIRRESGVRLFGVRINHGIEVG